MTAHTLTGVHVPYVTAPTEPEPAPRERERYYRHMTEEQVRAAFLARYGRLPAYIVPRGVYLAAGPLKEGER